MSREDTPRYWFLRNDQEYEMPGWAVYDIRRWADFGEWPDEPLLQAVLTNNLEWAFRTADHRNHPNLHAFVAYVFNEIPSPCWGSIERCRAWQDRCRLWNHYVSLCRQARRDGRSPPVPPDPDPPPAGLQGELVELLSPISPKTERVSDDEGEAQASPGGAGRPPDPAT